MPLCYVAPVATSAYCIILGVVFRIDLCRFRSEVKTEIIPNSAFDGGEKSEYSPFSLYRTREGDLRFRSSHRADLDASHMFNPLLGATGNAKRDETGAALKESML